MRLIASNLESKDDGLDRGGRTLEYGKASNPRRLERSLQMANHPVSPSPPSEVAVMIEERP